MHIRRRLFAAACAALLVSGFVAARYRPLEGLRLRLADRASATSGLSAVGAVVPDAVLEDFDGNPVRLSTVMAGRPTLLLVVSAEDCLSCANFPVEMRILRNKLPGLKRVFLATGRDSAFFRAYGRSRMITRDMILDRRGNFLETIGASEQTPAVLLLDTQRRVLLSEHRSGPGFSGFPLTEQLLGVLDLLNSAGAPRVAPGGEEHAIASVPMPEPGASTTPSRKAQ